MNSRYRRRRGGTALVAAGLVALIASSVAPAADKPVPCDGKLLVTDPAGDAFVGFIGLAETPVPAEENVDITGIFVNSIDGRVTFNVQVKNLDKTVGPGATANVYRVNYTVGESPYYLQAFVDSSGVAYSYGHLDTAGVVKDGDAKGAFYEGENGVIEIEVPPSHGGKPGTKWSDASLFSAYVRQRVNTQTDEAPDAGETFVYRGTTCASNGGPTGPSGPTGPTGPAPGPTGPVTPATGPLRVTVTPLTFKAKKVKKIKKIAFNVRPSESMTGVVLALKKGKKTLGSAKIGELQGAKTVKVKLRKKGLKKGRYAVVVTAKRPTGATATKTFKVSVK